jgi:predicted HTH transcriptional regulator
MTDQERDPIVHRGAESRDFDYKRPMAWKSGDYACVGLVCDILAMANTGGGQIVIGVAEADAGGWDWQGLSEDDARTWDQTDVANVVNGRYADPSVDFTLIHRKVAGKPYIVIAIQPFARVPHICRRSCEKGRGQRRRPIHSKGEHALHSHRRCRKQGD